jgi:hypothetical protein
VTPVVHRLIRPTSAQAGQQRQDPPFFVAVDRDTPASQRCEQVLIP